MHKLTDSILDKFSMDFLRNQVLKNAYGNDDTVIAGLDPRVLLIWYLFFGLVRGLSMMWCCSSDFFSLWY